MQIRTKKFVGLYTQPNPLSEVPEGALSEADNCVIDREGQIENRRGFNFFGSTVFSSAVNAFIKYKDRILAQFGSTLAYDSTGTGSFSNYAGSLSPISGQRVRGQEQNGSLFFTTSNGVYKVDTLTGTPRTAGVPKPLDMVASFASSATGSMPSNSQVAYRMVWGRKDANNVLTLSAPSQRTEVVNQLQTILTITETGGTATATTEGPHGYSNGDIVTIQNATSRLQLVSLTQAASVATGTTGVNHGLVPGDIIEIAGAIEEAYNGTYSVAATPSATTFEYTLTGNPSSPATGAIYVSRDADAYNGTYLISNITSNTFDYLLVGAPLADAEALPDTSIEVGKDEDITLTFPVPSGIIATDIYQVYRSEYTETADLTASDNMQLVFEGEYTSGSSVSITDVTPDDFKGADLYTNATQEGILQSNDQPPLANDIALYKSCLFYANTQTKQNLNLQFLSADSIVRDTDKITIGGVEYTFSSTESLSAPFKFRLFADINQVALTRVSTTATINTVVNHGLSVGDIVFLSGAADARYNDRFVVQTVPLATTFTITVDSTAAASDTVNVSTGTPAQNIAATVKSLCKVINRTNANVYAFYTSGPDDIPGSFQIVAQNLSLASFNTTSTVGSNFSPDITSAVASTNESIPNRLYFSKFGKPDSVPYTNYVDIGPRDERILRIVGLRDSLFIIKEDSIWRLAGEEPRSFVNNIFDSSVSCLGAETVSVLNNTIYMYTNQGVVSVGDGGVAIISRPIEDDILPFGAFNNASSIMHGVTYESERKYLLFHQALNTDTVPTAAYVYNTITQAWTRWTKPAKAGLVVNDVLYLANTYTNTVLKERKTRDKTDKKDESVAVTISNVSPDGLDLTIASYTYGGFPLSVGQLVEQSTFYGKVLAVNGNIVTVDRQAGFTAAAATIANPIRMRAKLLPQIAGSPDIMKHFREVQAYPVEDTFSKATLIFASDLARLDKTVDFEFLDREQGWGFGPWGNFPFGDSGNLTGSTPLRTYVPQGLQRCRGLTVGFEHSTAQEDIAFLNVGYVFEINSERTTR